MSFLWLQASDTQRRIVALAAAGASIARIASTLRLTEFEVSTEYSSFMSTNGLTNREQVGALAVRAGIV